MNDFSDELFKEIADDLTITTLLPEEEGLRALSRDVATIARVVIVVVVV